MKLHKITVKCADNAGWVMNVEKHWDEPNEEECDKIYVFTSIAELACMMKLTLDEEEEE